MRRKSFTLLEILFVVFLLSMIMVAAKQFFVMKNKDFIKSQTCVNYVAWEIKNSFDFVAFGRGFATWAASTAEMIYPNKMILDFNSSTDRISVLYSWKIESGTVITWVAWNLIPTFNLSWSWVWKYDCFWQNYFVNLSWWNLNVQLNYQLQWDLNNPSIVINNSNNIYTWESLFYYCEVPSMDCKIIWKIVLDKRSSLLKFNRCLRTADWKTCDVWGL